MSMNVDLLISVFSLFMRVLFIVVCYLIAKKYDKNGVYALLGFFGITGVIGLLLIIKFGSNNNYGSNYGNHYYNNPYNNQNYYNGQNGNPNYYNGQSGNRNYYNNGGYDNEGFGGEGTTQNTGEGYSYNGQGSYYDAGNERGNNSYVYNGEVIVEEQKNCSKCGAKINSKIGFCPYCGNKL